MMRRFYGAFAAGLTLTAFAVGCGSSGSGTDAAGTPDASVGGSAGTGGSRPGNSGGGGASSVGGGAGNSAAGAGTAAGGSNGSSGSAGDGGACVPNCAGRACGNDGCQGSCGSCGAGLACGASGRCATSNCATGCTAACPQGCFDLGDCTSAGGGTLDLEPNVFTMGGVVTLGAAPATGELYYRVKGTSTWWKGPDLVRIPDGRLAGSAFGLAPGTAYDVRVKAGTAAVCASGTTEAEDPANAVSREVWVDAAASAGGDGSNGAPFRTIQAGLDAAGAGVDVHVRAGVYREAVTVSHGGAAGRYLRLMGEPGAVLDGADAGAESGISWSDEGGGVWSTAWAGDPRYVSRDGARLYHYLSLPDLRSGTGKNGVPIAEGFFIDTGRLYAHLKGAPAGHIWQIPALNTALQVSGVSFVWVEGMEIRFYGEGDYAKGIDVTDAAASVVIRKNHVHDIPSAVWIRKGSSAVRIENNEIHQSTVFSWPWDAVKATDHENDAVTLAGGRGAIVANNVIHDVFNGVYAGSFDDDHNPALAYDVDVYGNRLARIGDDGFEPEGACINARFWGNVVDVVHNGVSLAPITFGPTWVVRNRFTDYQESGFKVSNATSGRVWLYHNTCFTDAAAHNGMNVSGAFENIVFRNNVIRGTSYAVESTLVVQTNDLDYDALFTTRGAPRVKWNDVRYDDLPALCTATGFECHGVGADPGLLAPTSGSFGPSGTSPLIDAAVRLYGINDAYAGAGPDIGYVEAGSSEPPRL
jgi:hypothetical protein